MASLPSDRSGLLTFRDIADNSRECEYASGRLRERQEEGGELKRWLPLLLAMLLLMLMLLAVGCPLGSP